jgi:hypothetical protein
VGELLAYDRQLGATVSIGKKSIMPDPVKSIG